MPDGKSISIQPFGIETVERFFHDTKGDGYDWAGMILSKVTPFHIKRTGRWYCSEWIAYALRLAGAVDNLYHYSDLTPQRLYEVLKKYAD